MMLYLASSLILFGSLFLLASLLTVIIHELGHAIPVLIWSRKKVTIFIGSYGDHRQSVRWSIGRLDISLKYNALLWIRGACRPGEPLSVTRKFGYIAMGPLASLALGLLCGYLLLTFHFDGHLKTFLFMTTWLSLLAFLGSTIIPGKARFNASGDRLYNDGILLIRTLRFGRLWPDLQTALQCIAEKKYDRAAGLLNGLLDRKFENVTIYRASIIAQSQLKNYDRAQQLVKGLHEKYRLNADDHYMEGFIHLQRNEPQEAMQCMEKALEIAPDHIYSLNGIGYALIVAGRPGASMPYLAKALELDPELAHAYSNRGWAKMQLGQWEEGFADVNYALTLDDGIADAFRNLGFYWMEKGNGPLARTYLGKAREMDTSTPFVDEYTIELDHRFPEIND